MQFKYAQTNLQLYNQMIAAGYPESALLMIKQGYSLALRLFAARCRGNEKPFICHLVGTASILVACDAEPIIVAAGLLHAAYSQGDFADGGKKLSRHNRQRVAEAVGNEVETLVAEYTKFPWKEPVINSLLESQQTYNQLTQKLIFVRVANALEDHLDSGTRYNTKDKYRNKPEFLSDIAKLAQKIGQPRLSSELLKIFAVTEAAKIPDFLICNTANLFNTKSTTCGWRVTSKLFKRLFKHG